MQRHAQHDEQFDRLALASMPPNSSSEKKKELTVGADVASIIGGEEETGFMHDQTLAAMRFLMLLNIHLAFIKNAVQCDPTERKNFFYIVK